MHASGRLGPPRARACFGQPAATPTSSLTRQAKIRAVSSKVSSSAAVDEEPASSTPGTPGDAGDAQARKRAREEQGEEAGAKKAAAAAAGESPAGTDVSAATTDAAAPAEAPAPEYEWQTSGHAWLGAYVARMFGKRTAVGRITKWVPPDAEDGALFH